MYPRGRQTTTCSVSGIGPVQVYRCQLQTNLLMDPLRPKKQTSKIYIAESGKEYKHKKWPNDGIRYYRGKVITWRFELVIYVTRASCLSYTTGSQRCHTKCCMRGTILLSIKPNFYTGFLQKLEMRDRSSKMYMEFWHHLSFFLKFLIAFTSSFPPFLFCFRSVFAYR